MNLMNAPERIIAAFSEEQAVRLTKITKSQLRYWDKTDFYNPGFTEDNRRMAFSRVYSFKDIVALRVLNVLRNQYSVALQHLREVSDKLSHLKDDRWTGAKLWVLNRRVVWQEPDTDLPQEIVSKQYLVPTVIIQDIVNDTRKDVENFIIRRDEKNLGKVEKSRYVNHNAPVIAGTRITVNAIKRFAEAGYTTEQILKEYPDLTQDDINAALNYEPTSNVA